MIVKAVIERTRYLYSISAKPAGRVPIQCHHSYLWNVCELNKVHNLNPEITMIILGRQSDTR